MQERDPRQEGLYLKFSDYDIGNGVDQNTPVVIERVHGPGSVSEFIIARDEAYKLVGQLDEFLREAASPKLAPPSCNASHVETEEGAGSATRHATSPSSAQDVPTPAPGAERLRERITEYLAHSLFNPESLEVRELLIAAREALAAAPPQPAPALTGYELAGCADRAKVIVRREDGTIWAADWDRFAAEVRGATPTSTQREMDIRDFAAELYQVCGSLGAPAPVLDQLSAAAQGKPLPYTTLLPFPDVAGDRHASAERVRELHGLVETLAHSYKGVLPYDLFGNDANLDADTRTRLALIADVLKKADMLAGALPPSTGEKA